MKREQVWLVVLVLVQVALAAVVTASAMSCTTGPTPCMPSETESCVDCGEHGQRRYDPADDMQPERCDCDPGFVYWQARGAGATLACMVDPCAPGGVARPSGLPTLECTCSRDYRNVLVPDLQSERCEARCEPGYIYWQVGPGPADCIPDPCAPGGVAKPVSLSTLECTCSSGYRNVIDPSVRSERCIALDAGIVDAGTGGGGDAGSGIITSFTSSSGSVPQGSTVTLSWTSTGDSCTLQPSQFSVLNPSDSVTLAVEMTTTFTLTCTAGSVSESRTLDVTATPVPPTITSFMAQSLQVTTGMNAELSWTTLRATACTLDPGAQSVTVPSGSVSLPITATTTYTLTCTGAVGPPATASITVTYVVNASPVAVIDTPANMASIEAGTPLTFTATCTDDGAGGTTLTHQWLAPGGVSAGTTEDLPAQTASGVGSQTWTYSCTDALGAMSSVQVTFTVTAPVFVEVVAGNSHACGVTASGRIFCWGNNAGGQVGVPGAMEYRRPVLLDANTEWAHVATGGNPTCASNTGGQLWCWGTQTGGVGDGVNGARTSPTRVDMASDWARVTVGIDFACARKMTGSLWCWGINTNGQLGQGTTTASPTPARVGMDSDWQLVEAGVTYVCGLRAGGTGWCWGDNSRGNLGDGTVTQRTTPRQFGAAITWQSVTTGFFSTCGISTAGALYCWGGDLHGQLGDGSAGAGDTPSPARVGMDSDWAQVSEGGYYTCARKTGNTLWCWGSDASAQLGNGAAAYSTAVVTQVGTGADWTWISAGDSSTLGLRTGGALSAWGSNFYGQLGIGSPSTQVEVPTPVTF